MKFPNGTIKKKRASSDGARTRKKRLGVAPVLIAFLGSVLIYLALNSAHWQWLEIQNSEGDKVATLLVEKGQARQKKEHSIFWNDVARKQNDLGPGDSIFTEDDARASLEIADQGRVEVQPNSLVVIEKHSSKDPVALKVEQGEVKLQIKKGAKPFSIKVKGKEFQVTSNEDAEVSIQVNPGNLTAPVEIRSRNPASVQVTSPDSQGPVAMVQPESVKLPVPEPHQIAEKLAPLPERTIAKVKEEVSEPAIAVPPPVQVTEPVACELSPRPGERFSEFQIKPEFFYTRIDGNEPTNHTKAIFLSGLNSGIQFSWKQHWAEGFNSHLSVGFSKVSMKAADTRTLANANSTYSYLSAGVDYDALRSLKFGFAIGMREEIFYHSSTVTELMFDSIAIPHVRFSLDYELVNLLPYSIGLGLKGHYLLPGTSPYYSVRSGTAFEGTLRLIETLPDPRWSLTGEIFYRKTFQNTSQLEQQRTDLGVSFGLSYSLKPR